MDRAANPSAYKYIIFDFDGVLAETNAIRFKGFEELFKSYPESQTQRLVEYAKKNGGISRYKKIRYFFEHIRGESIDDYAIRELAAQYSRLVSQRVIDADAVNGSEEFLMENVTTYDFAIVSGSDQEELRMVCGNRHLSQYFQEILGSPVDKSVNISNLLEKKEWKRGDCLYVGDSTNDYDAAMQCGIDFLGRESGVTDWKSNAIQFIKDLTELRVFLDSKERGK